MPILIKSIEGSIISNGEDDLGSINLINQFVGEIGFEDYINLPGFEGVIQNFSSVIEGEIFETLPNSFGVSACDTQIEFNLSF